MTISSFYDLVAFTTATTGTGTITVGSAVAGARTPVTAGIADGTVVSYSIKDGANYESGAGTIGGSGTTLARTTVLCSSNSNTAISLSGSATVSLTVLAQDINVLAMVQLGQIITSGLQSTVDFTSISGAYSSLKFTYYAQDSTAATSIVNLRAKINNDATAANYTPTARNISANGASGVSTIASSTLGVYCGFLSQASDANLFSEGEISFINYAGTAAHKNMRSTSYTDSTSVPNTVGVFGARWKNTAAINRVTFGTDGTAFTNGSVFTMYGLK